MRPQNGLLIFVGKETHSETKSWKSSKISTKSYNNNGKPWKSSGILRVKPNFFIALHFFIFHFKNLLFFIFSCFFNFSFFFHFFIFFQFSFFFHFFFFQFSSIFLNFHNVFLLSLFLLYFVSCFFFFLFFFFLFWVVRCPIFFWPQLLQDFLKHFFKQNLFLSRLVGYSFEAFFSFFFSCFVFPFLMFLCVSFSFFFFCEEKKVSSFLFSLYFFQICFIAGISIRV